MGSKHPADNFSPNFRFTGKAAELFGENGLFNQKAAADKTEPATARMATAMAADTGSDGGAMQAAIYDPQGKKADAFAVENMSGNHIILQSIAPDGAGKEDIMQAARLLIMQEIHESDPVAGFSAMAGGRDEGVDTGAYLSAATGKVDNSDEIRAVLYVSAVKNENFASISCDTGVIDGSGKMVALLGIGGTDRSELLIKADEAGFTFDGEKSAIISLCGDEGKVGQVIGKKDENHVGWLDAPSGGAITDNSVSPEKLRRADDKHEFTTGDVAKIYKDPESGKISLHWEQPRPPEHAAKTALRQIIGRSKGDVLIIKGTDFSEGLAVLISDYAPLEDLLQESPDADARIENEAGQSCAVYNRLGGVAWSYFADAIKNGKDISLIIAADETENYRAFKL